MQQGEKALEGLEKLSEMLVWSVDSINYSSTVIICDIFL
jgi:hypothetical protein